MYLLLFILNWFIFIVCFNLFTTRISKCDANSSVSIFTLFVPLYSPNDIIPNCFSPKYFVISTTTIWKLSYCLSLCASILNSKSYALFFSIPLITYVFSFSVITDVFDAYGRGH